MVPIFSYFPCSHQAPDVLLAMAFFCLPCRMQVAMNTTIAAASGGISVFVIRYVIKKKYVPRTSLWFIFLWEVDDHGFMMIYGGFVASSYRWWHFGFPFRILLGRFCPQQVNRPVQSISNLKTPEATSLGSSKNFTKHPQTIHKASININTTPILTSSSGHCRYVQRHLGRSGIDHGRMRLGDRFNRKPVG